LLLTTSKNVVTVKLADKIGLKKIKDFANNRFGITAELADDLSISIGSASISLLKWFTPMRFSPIWV